MISINTEELILQSMYSNNSIIIDNHDIVITPDNDYIIRLERRSAKLWYTDDSYKYICKLMFFNNIDTKLFEIKFTENEISILLDNISSFVEYEMSEIIIPSGRIGSYYISLICIENNIIEMIFSECNLYNNCIKEKIKFNVNKEFLINFCNKLYFSFLVDLDSTLYSNYENF